MRLYTVCPDCGDQTHFNSYYPTRGDLSKAKGSDFKIRCNSCNNRVDVHVNDLKAQKSKVAQLTALAIFLVGTPIIIWFLKDFYGSALFWLICAGVILIPVIVFGLITKQERNRVSSFNRHKVKR
jgi:Flp pilus assembly protein TadB